MSRVPVRTSPVFEILGPPEVVYRTTTTRPVGTPGALYFDVAANGTLFVSHPEFLNEQSTSLRVIHNWFDELNRLAPKSD